MYKVKHATFAWYLDCSHCTSFLLYIILAVLVVCFEWSGCLILFSIFWGGSLQLLHAEAYQ